MGQVGFDLSLPHLLGVFLSVKENETPYPRDVGFFGLPRVVLQTDGFPHLIEQFLRLRGHNLTSNVSVDGLTCMC